VQDPYDNQPYQNAPPYAPEPRRRMSGWLIVLIIVLVLVVALCLCVCVALLLAGPSVGNVFSTIVGTVEAMTPVP
jgi:flagellar basal body-associated protein FliL